MDSSSGFVPFLKVLSCFFMKCFAFRFGFRADLSFLFEGYRFPKSGKDPGDINEVVELRRCLSFVSILPRVCLQKRNSQCDLRMFVPMGSKPEK